MLIPEILSRGNGSCLKIMPQVYTRGVTFEKVSNAYCCRPSYGDYVRIRSAEMLFCFCHDWSVDRRDMARWVCEA